MGKKLNHKISFCTVSMNRLEHLKKTFVQNIKDNINYPDIEFVLLNYNSKDAIDQWVTDELKQYIEMGILNYYSTRSPEYFHRAHSSNMAFRLAQGDIICKIDADNFIGKDFAFFLNRCFSKRKNIFLSGHGSENSSMDTFGKVCLLKKDFWSIGGFDESMSDYGWDDIDFTSRLKRIGRKKVLINRREYLQSIEHDNIYRLENEKTYNNYHSIDIRYVSPKRSEILVLLKDESFLIGCLVLRDSSQKTFLENAWKKGNWELKDSIYLTFESGNKRELHINDNNYVSDLRLFNKIRDTEFLAQIKLAIPSYTNKRKMYDNRKQKISRVNLKGFGIGKISKNFDTVIQLCDEQNEDNKKF